MSNTNKKSARKKAIIRRRIFISCCALVLVAAISLVAFGIRAIMKSADNQNGGSEPQSSSSSKDQSGDNSSADKTPEIVSSATILNIGDIMVHSTQLDGAKTSSGDYDFSAFFKNISSYFKGADLSVANLEVTFGGTQSGRFSGYPAFNTPDSLADVIKASGIGLLTTSNNHCYDTGLYGLKRTAQVLKEKGIPFTGTKEIESDPTYLIKEVNGIKIGVISYTYENKCDTAGRKSINGGIIASEANNLINSFAYERIEAFYTEAQGVVEDMKNDGADAIVFYMHWGEEYRTSPNQWQKSISQKLCNIGVDVIAGGHPHVVQPLNLLRAEGSEHITLCMYSMGNAISNQRQELMDSCPGGYTEDGVIFSFKLDKYSDGSTVISAVDLIPTWVDKYKGGSGYQYTIYPLENEKDGTDKFGLSGTAATKSASSYKRTKTIVGAGLTECQQHFGNTQRFSE